MKKILLIGDSISLYYAPFLAKELADIAEVFTKEGIREAMTDLDRPTGGNGGDSGMVLEYFRKQDLAGALNFDLFVFNCGLHDIKRKIPEENININVMQYNDNLNEIYRIAEKNKLKTVFINSTAVDDDRHNACVSHLGFKRYDADLKLFNDNAEKIAKEHGVCVIDLNGFTSSLPGTKYIDHIHFDMEVRKKQAKFLAEQIISL